MFTSASGTETTSAVTAAAAQNENQPDDVTAVSSWIAVTSASTVCSSQIAHMKNLRKDIYNPSYERRPVSVSAFWKRMFRGISRRKNYSPWYMYLIRRSMSSLSCATISSSLMKPLENMDAVALRRYQLNRSLALIYNLKEAFYIVDILNFHLGFLLCLMNDLVIFLTNKSIAKV